MTYRALPFVLLLCHLTAVCLADTHADTSRISVAVSFGRALPLGAFAKSKPEQLVKNAQYGWIEYYQRRNFAAAEAGTALTMDFSYELNPRWQVAAGLGHTVNSIKTGQATAYLNQTLSPATNTTYWVSAVAYSVTAISLETGHRWEMGKNAIVVGPLAGMGILKYPNYEVVFLKKDSPNASTLRHMGAQPHSLSFLWGGFSEFKHQWSVRAKYTNKVVANVTFGLRLTYSISNFQYYTTFGFFTGGPQYAKDEINYRILLPMFSVAYDL